MNRYYQVPVTISNGQTVSNAADILGHRVVAVAMPSAWTAANIRFQIDPGDGTFRLVVDKAGNALEMGAAVDQFILLSAHAIIADQPGGAPDLVGANVKVVSTATQLGDRTIILICEKI